MTPSMSKTKVLFPSYDKFKFSTANFSKNGQFLAGGQKDIFYCPIYYQQHTIIKTGNPLWVLLSNFKIFRVYPSKISKFHTVEICENCGKVKILFN